MAEEQRTVADIVQALMQQRGWSYANLAGRAGLDPTTVYCRLVGEEMDRANAST